MLRTSILPAILLFSGCTRVEPENAPPGGAPSGLPAQDAPTGASAEARPASKAPTIQQARNGRIAETMDSGGYTYALVDMEGRKEWFALPLCSLSVGDEVVVPAGAMAMENFTSNTLKRTFEKIYFVQGLERPGKPGAAAKDAPEAPAPGPAAAGAGSRIEKPEGGLTVEEIWKLGEGGAGKEVLFRGRVVKFNGHILGKNWLHVQDGTGADGTNDIAVTTSTETEVEVGAVVLVRGKLAANRDFGAGYSYELIVEDAAVTVE
ncbi:MAG: hypothetical protein Fur0037_25540 [Planctomycetota bacterium]